MEEVKRAIDNGNLKNALHILINEKGIKIHHLCKVGNINSGLIYKYVNNTVPDIGADKKEAITKTIKALYL